MNKELEALLLSAAKALDYGVVGVNPARAREWGVPVGVFVAAGHVIPGQLEESAHGGLLLPVLRMAPTVRAVPARPWRARLLPTRGPQGGHDWARFVQRPARRHDSRRNEGVPPRRRRRRRGDAQAQEAPMTARCAWQTATGLPWTVNCTRRAAVGPFCVEHARDHRQCYPHVTFPGEAEARAVCHALRHLTPTPALKASGRCPKLFERKDLP